MKSVSAVTGELYTMLLHKAKKLNAAYDLLSVMYWEAR